MPHITVGVAPPASEAHKAVARTGPSSAFHGLPTSWGRQKMYAICHTILSLAIYCLNRISEPV